MYTYIYIAECELIEASQSKSLWFHTSLWFSNQAPQQGPPHQSFGATVAEAARWRVPKFAGLRSRHEERQEERHSDRHRTVLYEKLKAK